MKCYDNDIPHDGMKDTRLMNCYLLDEVQCVRISCATGKGYKQIK